MVTIFGLKPCCAAWPQKVTKSGGIMLPVTISQFGRLEGLICEVKLSFST